MPIGTFIPAHLFIGNDGCPYWKAAYYLIKGPIIKAGPVVALSLACGGPVPFIPAEDLPLPPAYVAPPDDVAKPTPAPGDQGGAGSQPSIYTPPQGDTYGPPDTGGYWPGGGWPGNGGYLPSGFIPPNIFTPVISTPPTTGECTEVKEFHHHMKTVVVPCAPTTPPCEDIMSLTCSPITPPCDEAKGGCGPITPPCDEITGLCGPVTPPCDETTGTCGPVTPPCDTSGGCITTPVCDTPGEQDCTTPPVKTPEPASWLILTAGIAGMALLRRREKMAGVNDNVAEPLAAGNIKVKVHFFGLRAG